MPALRLERVVEPGLELLYALGEFDREAFGETGLRSFDIGVFCRLGAVYVARSGDDVVGSCQLVRTVDEPDMLWVFGFSIRPAWRGRGLGSGVLALLLAELPSLGARGLVLTVDPGNDAALAMYRRAGFVRERFIADFYGPGEHRWKMRYEGIDTRIDADGGDDARVAGGEDLHG
jgi:ribosomal-protein-alanine N-acetyltransferase